MGECVYVYMYSQEPQVAVVNIKITSHIYIYRKLEKFQCCIFSREKVLCKIIFCRIEPPPVR